MNRIILIIVIILLVIIVLVVLAGLFLRPMINRYSRPDDLSEAKRLGQELTRSKGKTFVVVAAHPDDAEWWAGGTLATLTAAGNDVVLVMGTSGEAGADVPGLGAIREKKQKEAARILGYKKAIFLRHPDRHLEDSKDLVNEVNKVFRQYKPKAIITFDTEKESFIYRHADHEAAGRAAWAAGKDWPGMTYYLFHTSTPNTITEYKPVRAKKGAALRAVTSYERTSSWLTLLRPILGSSNRQEAHESYGEHLQFPEVGIEYGEAFRRTER